MDFLTFAWAKPWVDIVRQLFDKIFRIPYQISHLVIPILGAPVNAEKSYEWKTVQKMGFTGVKIAWVDVKSNKYPQFRISKWPA